MIGKRIKELRKHLKMNQTNFGGPVHLTPSAISHIEQDDNPPSPKTIKLICDAYEVNPDWLKTGKGEMFRKAAIIVESQAEQLSPSREALILANSFAHYRIEHRPITEVEKITDLLNALMEILTSEDRVMKEAIKSNLIAFREAVRDRIDKVQMKADIEDLKKRLDTPIRYIAKKKA